MEGLAVKITHLPLCFSLVFGVQSYAVDSSLFLDGVENIESLSFEDGSTYRGQVGACPLKPRCMQGVGIYTKKDSQYFGVFEANKPSGEGLFVFENGQSYEGNFMDGRLHGKGVMTYPDGRLYEGDFKNNQRNGFGVMIYQDGGKYSEGSRYEGGWMDDKRHGKGVMIYPNDSRRLIGEFRDDIFISS